MFKNILIALLLLVSISGCIDPNRIDDNGGVRPSKGLKVVIKYDIAKKQSYPRSQVNEVIDGTPLKEYMNKTVSKDSEGNPNFRVWSVGTDVENESQDLRDMFNSASSTPSIIIVNGRKKCIKALPKTKDETISLVNSYK